MKLKDVQNDKDLIEFGEDFFESSAKAKKSAEQKWLLNIAFIAGDQLAKVNQHTGALERINTAYDADWIVRTVDNRILPVYRLLSSKLTKNKPLPSATAHSREEADIQAGRAAVKLLGNHWGTLGLDSKHSGLANWLTATGNVFYKQFWNPKKGARVTDAGEMDAEAGLQESGEPKFKTKADFNLGDTDLLLRTPFNIYPQPGKTGLAECRYCGDAEIMDIEDIEELYDKDVPTENDNKYVKIHQTLVGTYADQPANGTTVKEMYILPCKPFPRGLIFRWANGILLSKEEYCDEIPITHFGLIEVPGQFWFKGIVDDLIPIQKRWNTLLSKIEQHNDYYNDPPIIVDPQIINIDDWTTEPGTILERLTSGGANPFVLPVPMLDPGIFSELNLLDAQFEVVPVLNKVSYGKDTPNATSGTAINFLQEKDNDVIRPLIDQIETGYAEVFKRDFKLCQENYDEDRGFAIVGADNKVEWVEFTKANLEASIDVGVEPGSAMPRSKVAQQAFVMDMLTAGFFNDPETGLPDYAKAMKYLEFGQVDDIYQDNALDTNQAQRENEHLKDGEDEEVTAEDWHNHQAHVYEHNRLRKTADYEDFDDSVKEAFSVHVAEHLEFLNPPAPEPAAPGGQPTPEELQAFVQSLPADVKQQLAALPEAQLQAAVLQLYNRSGGGGQAPAGPAPAQEAPVPPEPAPAPAAPVETPAPEPTPEELQAFIEQLPENVKKQISTLSDEEQRAAVMELYAAYVAGPPQQ